MLIPRPHHTNFLLQSYPFTSRMGVWLHRGIINIDFLVLRPRLWQLGFLAANQSKTLADLGRNAIHWMDGWERREPIAKMKAEEKKMQRNVKNKILILTTHRTSPPLSFEPIPKVKTTNFLICRLKHSTRDFFFFFTFLLPGKRTKSDNKKFWWQLKLFHLGIILKWDKMLQCSCPTVQPKKVHSSLA